MSDIHLTIDGQDIKAARGKTILETAVENHIQIPSLCHQPETRPTGVCRVCVVEVEGARTLVGSCHTPVSEGMVIHTGSARVLDARKVNLELLMTGHTGSCVTDTNARNCNLHQLASDVELGPPRFHVRRPRYYPVENVSPYIWRDLSKCIMCRRCISACSELAGQDIFSVGYRGFRSKIVAGFDEPLHAEICRDCGICVDHCPTGALIKGVGLDPGPDIRPAKETGAVRERADLLEALKASQKEHGRVSRESMEEISRSLDVPLSGVFGVASFYSFLSVETLGGNVIRVCKSLPCYLKDSTFTIACVQKELGIVPGQTTDDNRFSFETANCIGACDQAPAMLVNDDVHGHLTSEKISGILRSYN
ncbi:MAG: NAD(P)H-dependent oxidoreductase subunit E [Deltaproteobacteria bacterium]|nr:NAD(P)H-dependent oxidoreductase subunit E [Deltaproteobacteria bacterium]